MIWTPKLWLPNQNKRRFNLPRYRYGGLKQNNPGCNCCCDGGCDCTGDCGAGEVCQSYFIETEFAAPCDTFNGIREVTDQGLGICCWFNNVPAIAGSFRWHFNFRHNGTDLEARVVLFRFITALQVRLHGSWSKVVESCQIGSGLEFTDADAVVVDHNAFPDCSLTASGDDISLPCISAPPYAVGGSDCDYGCTEISPASLIVTCGDDCC